MRAETPRAWDRSRIGNSKITADLTGEDIGDFRVAGHRRSAGIRRIDEDGIACAFSQ